MSSRIDLRDLLAGLLLAAFGLFVALYATANYDLGSLTNIGPGMFPAVLGWMLVGLGGFIAIPTPARRTEAVGRMDLRSMAIILAAVAAFAPVLVRFGMVPAIIVLTVLSALAERPFRLVPTLILAGFLALLAYLVFAVGLGIELPAFAWEV